MVSVEIIQHLQVTSLTRPLLELKLVSDATYAQDMDFPRITTMEPRRQLGDLGCDDLEMVVGGLW